MLIFHFLLGAGSKTNISTKSVSTVPTRVQFETTPRTDPSIFVEVCDEIFAKNKAYTQRQTWLLT